MRAPLSTLLGLQLVRLLLACSRHLLTRLSVPSLEVEVSEDEAASDQVLSPSWQSRTATRLRRYSQRQRARYVRWRETDTTELVEQLRTQCESLRDGVVTSPQTDHNVSRQSEVSNSSDWTDRVRQLGSRLVTQSQSPTTVVPSQTVAGQHRDESADPVADSDSASATERPKTTGSTFLEQSSKAPSEVPTEAPTEPKDNGTLKRVQTNTVTPFAKPRPTSKRPYTLAKGKTSKQPPVVIPVTKETGCKVYADEALPATTDSSPLPIKKPAASQPIVDTTRWVRAARRDTNIGDGRRTVSAPPVPAGKQQLSSTPNSWPSLPDEVTRSSSQNGKHSLSGNHDEVEASRWPSLPEFVVSVESQSPASGQRTSRLEAEQSGTLWNE